jgi:hypothetical protein
MKKKRIKNITRREFCGTAAAVGAALMVPEMSNASGGGKPELAADAGSWPAPRQNRQLTAIQPLPGKMKSAPKIAASLPFPRGQGMVTAIASKPNGKLDRAIVIADGRLRCYGLDGKLHWESHPAGLNFQSLVAAEDIDADGRVELALMAGRPTAPLGAAVVVDAETGKTRFRYDVEPMSYWWTMQVDDYLPNVAGKQIVVCEHAYPPDEKFGYIVLFDFEKPGSTPRQRWRYDFDHYTCFPPLLRADVDGDGVKELCVETHSRMWVLKVETGKVHQYIEWDVSPANIRSYGLVRFQDLNNDGLPEFFCIANFAHHHEVLLNEKGKLKRAWAHGWEASVTTQTLATSWPDPPIADVDGDGKLEMLVSMYASDGKPRWMTRIYDALTGELKLAIPDRIATHLTDLDSDGVAEILSDISTDPTQTDIQGAALLKVKGKNSTELWNAKGVRAAARRGEIEARQRDAATELCDRIYVQEKGQSQRLTWETGKVALRAEKPPTPPPGPDFSRIPATVGNILDPPLVADIDGDGKNEVIHFYQGQVTLYRYDAKTGFTKFAEYTSTAPPAVADLDGDGKLELIIGTASATTEPVIKALRPGRTPESLWNITLPKIAPTGMPYGKPLVFQTGRFLGREGFDIYVYAGTPFVRSLVLNGSDGALVWEKGKIPDTERYYAPTVNLSAVWDFDGDGKDDLVFTCPDYYCVASGPTGEGLFGPALPPKIFNQPSMGLYTFPAVLPNAKSEPTVCLVDGHYFQAAMTAHARPMWYHLPIVGEAKSSAEGFLQKPDGSWLMGFGRQNGKFACVDVTTGKVKWEFPLEGSASAISACDIDGDGKQEFVFGTSHGELYALADAGSKARVVWKAKLPAGVGTPVIADVDNDGASEILVGLGDGRLCLLRA